MQKLKVTNLSVEFRRYHEVEPSLKIRLLDLLRRRHRGPETFLALSEVSLEIGAGERVGIVGMNGAGKSTLLKTMVGIYPPSAGAVEVCGQVLPLLELGAGFDPDRSARENIFLNGAILGLTREQVRLREAAIIEFAELSEFIDAPVHSLSSGMRARLGFSIAASLKPEILILDEVFAAGDKAFIEKARARIGSLIDDCKILLFVSHNEKLVRDLCERIIVLHHGRVMHDGTADESFEVYNRLIAATKR